LAPSSYPSLVDLNGNCNENCNLFPQIIELFRDSCRNKYSEIESEKVVEEQVKIAKETLTLASQRYKLGLSSIVEVTQSEVAVTAGETRLAETQYDAKIAEARLRFAIGGI
jgi:outer membrane protein TolC